MTTTKLDIESSAVRLLSKYDLLRTPVPIEHLAEKLGISIHYQVLGNDVSALLVIKNNQSNIIVNATQHANRQRFSIAHEIGHFHLHHSGDKAGDRLFVDKKFAFYQPSKEARLAIYARSESFSKPEEEREANEFAASLLMPAKLVRAFVKENPLDLSDESDLSQLASVFRVSEQAMSIRVQHLKLVSNALYS